MPTIKHLFWTGSKQALLSALNVLDEFSKVSGLKLNEKKTEALWIGSSIGNDKRFLPGKDLKWPESKVKTLGLWLSVESEIAALLNYNEKVEKIRKIVSCWKYRRLTLLGRITVLKSLAASQLVYLLSPLPSNYSALNQSNKLFCQFLWNGKDDKIRRKIMINDYCDGGLKMIDLISFNKATWVKKYLEATNNAQWIFFIWLQQIMVVKIFLQAISTLKTPQRLLKLRVHFSKKVWRFGRRSTSNNK